MSDPCAIASEKYSRLRQLYSLAGAWTSNAEVDFQRLPILNFRSHSDLMRNAFYKTMRDAGIPKASVAEADVDMLISEYSHNLAPRPGLFEMIQVLCDGVFTVRCCSDASPERVRGYFENVGVDMPIENFYPVICAAAKLDPEVYQMVKKKLGFADATVFAAAHAWDWRARKGGVSPTSLRTRSPS
ncbi:hypothetical protein B0H12DRAFT_1067562 [Mycena haematopus]|nr:hypothetical protein B0H12DRAFT_1067562 [Mycena haematopus]